VQKLGTNSDFIGYVGIPDFHDGIVLRVSVEGKTAEVVIKGFSGNEHRIVFEGVEKVEMNAPEGMTLYALNEMKGLPPLRKFVFTNSDEDHPGSLTILASNFSVCSN